MSTNAVMFLEDCLSHINSSKVYIMWCTKYLEFFNSKTFSIHSEESVFAFLRFCSSQYAPTSLWQAYSCLCKVFLFKFKLNISKDPMISSFLKGLSKNHLPKKSMVLSKESIEKFLADADNKEHLINKCAIVIGIHGLTRISELCNLNFENVTINQDCFIFNIVESKTDQAKKGWNFHVLSPFTFFIQMYIDLFKTTERSGRFFRNFTKEGKPTVTPMGKNKIGKIPCIIASFLGLPDANSYTGHCMRRSGATLLADNGASKLMIKRAGRWKSDTVCDGYIDDSTSSKIQIANVIGSTSHSASNLKASESAKSIVLNGCSNVVINL
jgi:integrase